MATLLDDEVDPYAKYLVGPASSVSVGPAVGFENAKPIAMPKVNTANLAPDLQARISQLSDLYKADTVLNPKGEDLPITSGYRTREQQRQLYLDRLKNPNLVAEPGKSRHESGQAIDLHPRIPDSLLEKVGLHRPHGNKDIYHVQVNPAAMETVNLNPDDIDPYSSYLKEQGVYLPSTRQAINAQFTGINKDIRSSDYYTNTLPKQAAALGDVVYSALPAAVKFVGEPFAKLVDKLGDTKMATEALDKVTQFADRPIGKAFGITNDPAYNAEAANRMMDYVGKNMDKGADYLAKETGLPKSDVSWFMNAALIAAGPAVVKGGKLVKEVGEEALPMVKQQLQEQYQNVKGKVQEKFPSLLPEENPNLRSVGASEVPKVQQRINNARSLLEPIELPRDIATRDFADIQYAREKAKEPEIGAPLRQNYAKINEQVIRNFDREIEATGAQLTGIERGELGQRLNDVVAVVKKERYDKVQDAYTAADTAGETLQQVPYKSITVYIADKRPTVVEQNPILKQVKEELEHNDPNGTGSISLRQMEDIRQLINSEVEPGTSNGFHGKKIREDIDKITNGKGGQLYQQARSLNHQYMKEFEETPSVRNITATKKNTTERTVPLETLAEKTMLSGPRSHVVEVFKTLENAGPEGQAMINELRGVVAEQIKNESLQSARLDVNGNPTVSADKLNKIINKLDKSGKLELIFGKQGAERYRTLNEVSKDIYTTPEGAVNTSNTGVTVKGYLADIATTYALSGVPAPAAHILKMGKEEVVKRRDLNRINEFINYGKEK
jgi:methionine aminopeptidase